MNQLPPNPESRRLAIACVALLLSLVALLCLGLAGRVGVLLLSSQGLFLVSGLVVLFFVSIVSVIMTFHHWWLFRKFTKPRNLLAVWHYSEVEWREFQRAVAPGFTWVAAIGLGFAMAVLHEMLFASTSSTLISLTVYGLLVVGASVAARRHVDRSNHLCILSRRGCYDAGGFGYSPWHPSAVTCSVRFDESRRNCVLHITVSRMEKTSSVIDILVPAGREAEAVAICGQLD